MSIAAREKVLVLGATGMLGNTVLRYFAQEDSYDVIGSARSASKVRLLPENAQARVICGVDVENIDSLTKLFATAQPDVVINCIGLVKQLAESSDPLAALPINAQLPHRLARLCAVANARLIHLSTDCVFAGRKGMYLESDFADANDLYGRSKFLGEVDYPNAVTLRTSIIGHELGSAQGLVEWFLSQSEAVRGFTKAVFSGLPTVELARVMHDYVIPNKSLHGVWHVSAAPIAKHDLLQIVARAYEKSIAITPDESLAIDRSLDSSRFRKETGYVPPAWTALVEAMRSFG
jgi:dTDP-4-dehydrorhamnose reductase